MNFRGRAEIEGELSLGGRYRQAVLEPRALDLRLDEKSSKEEWGFRINVVADSCQNFYIDGSKLEMGLGGVGGGWFAVDFEGKKEECRS